MFKGPVCKTKIVSFNSFKTFILSLVLFFTPSITVYTYENYNLESWNANDWVPNAVTDPAIGSRCLVLAQKRNNKVNLKVKIIELISKNNELIARVPLKQTSIKETLKETQKKLQGELRIVDLGIESITEDLLLKGCPAVSF